jgi:hypothetical protein
MGQSGSALRATRAMNLCPVCKAPLPWEWWKIFAEHTNCQPPAPPAPAPDAPAPDRAGQVAEATRLLRSVGQLLAGHGRR